MQKNKINQILKQYETLCSYCDTFFVRMLNKYPHEIQCKTKCSSCCKLSTVTLLEAVNIRKLCDALKITTKKYDPDKNDYCPFLHNGLCVIYNSRPIICRTHGLILNQSNDYEEKVIRTCELNFVSGIELISKKDIFDENMITNNRIKLNLALCLHIGALELANIRIPLEEIPTSGQLTLFL